MFPGQPNQSLIDGITILQTITAAEEPLGTRQLARMLGLDATRVNRLAKTLAALGLLSQAESRKYVVGSGIHVLAAQSMHASGLLRAAAPVLESLYATGHIVSLGMIWKSHVSYLFHGHTGMSVAESVGSTGIFPAATSGIGIALLAQLADEDIALLHPDVPESAFADIAKTRKHGRAYVVRKRNPVNASLGVALSPETNSGAAIALAGEIKTADIPKLLPVLRDAAVRIGERLKTHE